MTDGYIWCIGVSVVCAKCCASRVLRKSTAYCSISGFLRRNWTMPRAASVFALMRRSTCAWIRAVALPPPQWLADADERQLREVIRNYGEERFAKQIAAAIVAARARSAVATTLELAGIVATAVRTREPGQNPATRTFQALRIHVNQELEELTRVLPQCVAALAPEGRLVVISFHSLEDRIVKRFLRAQSQPPHMPARLPLRAADLPQPKMRLIGRPQRPARDEVAANPRARSAVMRIAERNWESPA